MTIPADMAGATREAPSRRSGDAESGLFVPGWKAAPYWHDDRPSAPTLADRPPERADVLVVGSGYTGLSAALVTQRAGRTTVVLDAGDAGAGCSTRNGGQVSAGVKHSQEALAAMLGEARARAIRAEGRASLDWLETLVAEEGIHCGFRRTGRFHAAHTPAAYDKLARTAERHAREEGLDAHAVPKAEQQREIGTEFYYGGVVFPGFARVHPAQYHAGLLARVTEAGATVVPHCPALGIRREGEGFEVRTPHGTVRARDVVVATNGYTSALTPWLRRRVIPIGSYMIATEPLAPEALARAFPTDRIACDTRRVVYYYGPSPDGTRIVFESDRGGRQQLYVMPSSGGSAQRISFGSGSYGTPVWSPRGDRIAFTKIVGGRFHIGVMRTDGTDERLLSASFLEEGPTWSPNGRVIMFYRESPGENGRPELMSIDISGRNLRRVPTPNAASDPAWSPLRP